MENLSQEALLGFFQQQHVVVQALIATVFTWLVTALGATPVFLTKRIHQRYMDGMLARMSHHYRAEGRWRVLRGVWEAGWRRKWAGRRNQRPRTLEMAVRGPFFPGLAHTLHAGRGKNFHGSPPAASARDQLRKPTHQVVVHRGE